MQFTLNRRSTVPMYRQLAAELREQIVSGAMAEGYRLPPERELASRLEVNRTTVLQAYQQLKDEGLIASKVGKGTFVLPLQHIETARIPVVRHEPIDEEPKPSVVRPPWSVLFSDYSNRFTYHDIASAERAQRGDTIIDFATGDVVFEGPTENVIADGAFQESVYRSAPYFDLRIDGITELNNN